MRRQLVELTARPQALRRLPNKALQLPDPKPVVRSLAFGVQSPNRFCCRFLRESLVYSLEEKSRTILILWS